MESGQIKLPKPDQDFSIQDIDTLLAMCIWGEARGEIPEGRQGVGAVIRTRSEHPRWWGHSYRSVILNPLQFSCFNEGNPNREKMLLPLRYDFSEVWDDCYWVAVGILDGSIADPTGGADSYFDDSLKNRPPHWAMEHLFKVKIGRLAFYKVEI